MKLLRLPRIPLAAFTLLLLFTLFITSCASLLPQPEPTPVVQTRVVTQQVIRQVTLEVTQVVEVPVTVTPTETLQVTYPLPHAHHHRHPHHHIHTRTAARRHPGTCRLLLRSGGFLPLQDQLAG
jgi:hypothetical protein